jgi:hypothetical protein
VNGKICSKINFNNNLKRKVTNHPSTPNLKCTKILHKFEIIGDSLLKGFAITVIQYVNTKFKVCTLSKPGAITNQLVDSQLNDYKCLGKSDAIVINGRTNDIDNCNVNVKGILTPMIKFIQKYNNTNIVIVNIPHRYDLMNLDKKNLCIQAYNSKLQNMLNSFKHVSLVEMSTNRCHYTKHGFHLNRH